MNTRSALTPRKKQRDRLEDVVVAGTCVGIVLSVLLPIGVFGAVLYLLYLLIQRV